MGAKSFSISLIIASMAYVLNGQTQPGIVLPGPRHGKIVVCYLATWSIYAEEDVKFIFNDMDPSLCTHLIYAYAGLNEDTMTVKSIDSGLDTGGKFENTGYKAFIALKNQYPHLKVTVAIGGWNEGNAKFSKMAASRSYRARFIQSVLVFLDAYKFDGIDMHKHPSLGDKEPYDRANYMTLMKELKEAFRPYGYILTIVVSPIRYSLDAYYDLPLLNNYVDLIHVLAYDYHGAWENVVGINAPLNGLYTNDVFSVEYTIQYMLSRGVSPNKIVLGLPLFGRTYILENPDVADIEFGSTPTKGDGFPGPYTKENGVMDFIEICKELTQNDDKWDRLWHEQSSTPYLRDRERVITYDNARSLAMKVKKMMEYDLAGVMIWSLDADDFKGVCDRDVDYIPDAFPALNRFVERFNRIATNPILQRVLKDYNLPDAQKLGNLSIASEVAHKNHLWTTESKTNYPLLRAIDESITLALEERLILMDMAEFVNDIPKEATSTNSLLNVVCYFCFF